MRRLAASAAVFLLCVSIAPPSMAQGPGEPERRLRIIEPAEAERLDPAFEMIMEKLDTDLKHILSSPVRATPKATALAGLTVIGTLYLINEDEDFLSEVSATRGDRSDSVYSRLRVLGRHVPETAAGLYLLGYLLDDRSLKSRSLESFEAVALTALVAAASGYVLGHKSPEDSDRKGSFRPFDRYHSMPDMDTSLTFALGSVFAYDRPWHQSLFYYGIAAGTALSRLYYEESWPSDVFLGAVLGTVIGRTVAYRAREGEKALSVLPVLEYRARPAVGLKLELRI